jgi:hypothetical protein
MDTLEQKNAKLKMRKRVETTISDIKKCFQEQYTLLHRKGFLIKLTLFVFGIKLNKLTSNLN